MFINRTIVSSDVSIEGTLTTNDASEIIIGGAVSNIHAPNSHLILEPSGTINGDATCKSADIQGAITGTLTTRRN